MCFRWLLFVFFLISSQAIAQKTGQALIDSLVREIPKATNDTIKGRLIKRVADEYYFINIDRALEYSRVGLKHVTGMKWKRGIAVFNFNIGRAYSDKGNYDSSMFFYNRSLALHREANDQWNIATALNNMGVVAQNIASNYPEANRYYFEALKIGQTLKDKHLTALGYDNISQIYLVQKNYSKALDYALRSLKLRQQQNDTPERNAAREVGNSLVGIANIYTQMGQGNKAKAYYLKAISNHTQVGNKEGLANTYSKLSILFGKNYPRKIEYALKSKQLWDEINPMNSEAIINIGNLGIAYLDRVRYDSLHLPKAGQSFSAPQRADLIQAEKYLQEAIRLSTQKGERDPKSYYTGVLAELQALKGDYKNAYQNFRYYQEIQDSLYSQESKNKIAAEEGKHEIELRDKEIELNKLALENQRKQRIGLLIGLGLLLVIGGLLYWQNLSRKRTNTTLLHLNAELDEANKIKAKFFAILSHDLRSPVANLISFLNLQKEAPELLTPEMTEANQKRITASAEALLENMEAMLLWSKGQMQAFKPQVKTIEVSELFTYIQKFFDGTTGVQFRFDNPYSLHVVTDEDYLKTIMQNLTSNAVKALKNKPNASIHWEARQEENQIILAITDNGAGVSEQQLNALYTNEASIGTKTGLGLHLIRDLAQAISCKIAVKSTTNTGTEFQLVFTNA
ncbi:tetratricopeptide repeat-containing sensor histidine kinase [Runella sp.]|uniref:tetratricopeptide repeat-containing sensor histidine kinase n=1 Tax=Runella sp. TaxID=1960881 RepID=UPI003D11ADBB